MKPVKHKFALIDEKGKKYMLFRYRYSALDMAVYLKKRTLQRFKIIELEGGNEIYNGTEIIKRRVKGI